MKQLLTFLSISLLAVALHAQTPRRAPQHDPLNPNVHDPVLAKEGDTYYLFCTGMGIGRFSSKDLKSWDLLDGCFAEAPAWTVEALPGFRNHMWAPDIIYHQGKWHLFYSCSAFAKNTSVIGHATTPTLNPESPDYKWTDHGLIVQSVPNRDHWNAIDPNIIVDEKGTPWMNFGSFWGGMKLVKLTDDMMGVAQPEEWYTLSRRDRSFELLDTDPGDGAVEAPFIYKHGDWYYLLVSFDYCCRGKDSDYKVAVGRSKNVEGPYYDKDGKSMEAGGGSIIFEGDDTNWVGVGHCAAYTIDGQDLFLAHAYEKETGASKLVFRTIEWEDEWPVLKW